MLLIKNSLRYFASLREKKQFLVLSVDTKNPSPVSSLSSLIASLYSEYSLTAHRSSSNHPLLYVASLLALSAMNDERRAMSELVLIVILFALIYEVQIAYVQ